MDFESVPYLEQADDRRKERRFTPLEGHAHAIIKKPETSESHVADLLDISRVAARLAVFDHTSFKKDDKCIVTWRPLKDHDVKIGGIISRLEIHSRITVVTILILKENAQDEMAGDAEISP